MKDAGAPVTTNFRTRCSRAVAVLCLLMSIVGIALLSVTSHALAVQSSRATVTRTVEEFLVFARQHNDATTAVESFLLRQQPDASLATGAVVDGNLVEVSHAPRSLIAQPELVHAMLSTPTSSGVFQDSEHGPVPWARVIVAAQGSSAATLLVAHFPEDAIAYAQQYVRLSAVIGLALAGLGLFAGWAGADMFRRYAVPHTTDDASAPTTPLYLQ